MSRIAQHTRDLICIWYFSLNEGADIAKTITSNPNRTQTVFVTKQRGEITPERCMCWILLWVGGACHGLLSIHGTSVVFGFFHSMEALMV